MRHIPTVTIHDTPQTKSLIADIVDAFPTLWQDTGWLTYGPESDTWGSEQELPRYGKKIV